MFQITPYSIPFAVGTAMCLALVGFAIRQGRSRQFDAVTTSFLALMVAVSVWSLARLAQLSVQDPTLKTAAIVALYLGYCAIPLALPAFAFSYTGREELLTPRIFAPLGVAAAVVVVLAATNGWHGWLWTASSETFGGRIYLDREFTTLFNLIALSGTAINLTAACLFLRYALTADDIYGRQAVSLAVGAVVPIVLATLYAVEQTPLLLGAIPGVEGLWTAAELDRNVDLTPVGFAVTGVCFWYAVFRFRFLDLVPVARDTVVEHMQEGYLVLDDEDRIVDLNPAAAALLDVSEAVVGTQVTAACPPLSEPIEAHERGERTEAEVTLGSGDDQRFVVATVSTPGQEDGEFGRLCVLRDVTDRRAIQKRFRTLIEQSSDLIYVLDEDARVKYASPSVERQFGVPPEAIEGENALDFLHAEDRPETEEILEHLLSAPEYQPRFEYRIPDAEGEWRVVEAVGRNLLENPFVEGIVLNARDITDRKERERELERTNRRLEDFASVVSHDLRNPLNVAEGHLDLAIETGDEESLHEVRRSHDRMKAIIEEVLTMAREGQSVEDPEPVDVETVARDAWSNVAATGADLVVESDGTVDGDGTRLLQLFENLFRNAVEHGSREAYLADEHKPGGSDERGSREEHEDSSSAEEEGATLTIRVGVDDETLYVADDGVGIPEDERDEVFDSGYTTAEDGTGFGLAIVEEIAEAHSWTVDVTESTDGGARFEFDRVTAEALARQ